LLADLFLLFVELVELRSRRSELAGPLATIVLFAALVDGRQHAKRTVGDTRSAGTHRQDTRIKDAVGTLIATRDAVRKVSPWRYNLLRTQVLETRTKEEGASVKDFAVPR
jgi:hypothetical protein